MKPKQQPRTYDGRVKSFPDAMGIECVRCPECKCFIPNVGVAAKFEEIISCPDCKLNFRLEKLRN